MIDLVLEKSLFGPEGKMKLQVSCQIENGELIGIYGPSGAGKSSILRLISGLMKPERGLLKVDGEVWYSQTEAVNLKPTKRNIGMVFQEHSLFPNMSISENLEFALSKGQNPVIVQELLERVGLKKLASKKPSVLSGGQKQRVALARAMIRKPKILLLDEPFSALDMKMRAKLQEYLVQFHNEYGLTTLLVSHDASEISRMAQRVLVMENGKFSFDGEPRHFFQS
ncbi:sulfate/molybdate ABC transporter ATP-binding protein [Cyclobacterium jeungdonense]|uniref:ATP-binding cassette domain-containing protein n=1 Tax=Cyclobacterium jeungdonense TaxID=708087 RepID=A0ABT8C6C5_9BACT|nr:ATP-binding cassette domain-containing protein [Cyclobacterium jeungdonense]MDN3687652.1 ATP-binding cassette domain-containing protein [Cyclobacterium jeungdonense]